MTYGKVSTSPVTMVDGQQSQLQMDATGALRVTGGGSSGGGSTPSATLSVQRATGTGTTATVASDATASARRTIRNIGTSAIEFGPSGVTYGAGMPLAAGESFTFDDTGRYTGAIYAVAAGGAAWSTATVSY